VCFFGDHPTNLPTKISKKQTAPEKVDKGAVYNRPKEEKDVSKREVFS